jgi:hypothetical protein
VRRALALTAGLAVLGAVISAVALAGDPHRFAYGCLWAFALAWTAALGALFFVALQHLTRSLWSVVVRRVAEALAASVGIVVLLAVPVVVFAWMDSTFHLFPWLDPDRLAADPVVQAKAPYLDLRFLTLRLALFCLLWWAASRYFVGRSLSQDASPDPTPAALGLRRWSAPFMVAFAFSVTFASFDLLMSLSPTWFSTIFGVYVFSGMFLAGLATITLAVLGLRARGLLGDGVIRDEHLYTLGGLMFAMSCFWAYIAFSQYLLIWSAGLPEETGYYVLRIHEGWLGLTLAIPILRFVVPFLVLMSRPAKMSPRLLAAVSVLVLVGQALDLYWMVMPEAGAGIAVPSLADLGPLMLMAGATGVVVVRFLARYPAMPVGDPLLARSIRFHL